MKTLESIQIGNIIMELNHTTNLTRAEIYKIEEFLKNASYEVINRLDDYTLRSNMNLTYEIEKEYKRSEKQKQLDMPTNEYSTKTNNSILPYRKPPEDDIERMALKTICSECTNFLYRRYERDKCKDPHDGKIDHITGESKSPLVVLNPSGYGCPNFNPLPTKKTNAVKDLMKEDRAGAWLIGFFSLFGLINIPYWVYQLSTLIW